MDCQSRIWGSWRLSLVALVLLLISFFRESCSSEPITIKLTDAERWANTLGERLNITSVHYSGVQYLRQEYEKREAELNVARVEGDELLTTVRTKISEFLQKKVEAVEKIVTSLESSIAKYNFSKDPPVEYLNALEINPINDTDLGFSWDLRFDSQNVLLENSTIHVPTVVYEEDVQLLREIEASDVLESVFVQNFERDYTLKWQYYGSKVGFMRNFPGINWTLKGGLNLFDCRQRSWYSQAIAPPKTVLFLVDMSGSQTGLALGMTHLMVMNTIDSLEENDYFNIMTFNKTVKFVDKCYEDTFLQATHKNKERMKEKLKEIKPQQESRICNAVKAVFDVLEKARDGPSSECSESIMLFTDGVEFACGEIFEERNKNRTVRVFTYLLGESNQHARILQEMACTNHGKYTRITVRSDVPEKVADYLPVLGRPLVQRNIHPVVWSNTYSDFLSEELVFTVSQVVHNTTVNGRKNGTVAGVASVDVPIKTLQKVVPPYKFGVNGYMFMITNNGFITHHPDRKSKHKGQLLLDISTQDITDVEQSAEFDQLRRDMIDRNTGSMEFAVERPYKEKMRLKELTQKYFYTEIQDTPFSLAVVLTADGEYQINPVKTVDINSTTKKITGNVSNELRVLMNLTSKNQVKLAEWFPCWLLKTDTNESSVEYFKMFLQEIANETDPAMATVTCDIDWTNLILLDLRATANLSEHWNYLYNISGTGDGMVSSFLATAGGLNQYYDFSENGTEGFVHEYSNTITEDYFARSVNDVMDNGFVYSFPIKEKCPEEEDPVKKKETNDTEAKVPRVRAVTAYSAVKVNNKTVAVAGIQMTVEKFEELFRNATSSCEDSSEECNHCTSKGVDCLLMDNDGYILASSWYDSSTVGQRLACVDIIVFNDLVNKKIMYRRNYVDFQALRKKTPSRNTQSAASILLNPLSQMKNLVVGFVQNTFVMLTTFGWYDWLITMLHPPPASGSDNEDDEVFEPCDENYTYYKLNITKISSGKEGYIIAQPTCDQSCINSYVVVVVPGTNLALLVITRAGNCECTGLEAPAQVEEVNCNSTDDSVCEDDTPVYRRPPPGCIMSTPTELEEESTECGAASFLQPSKLLLILATFHLFTRCLVA